MRHRIGGRKLNRTSQHRQMLFRNMAQALIKHEQIVEQFSPEGMIAFTAEKAEGEMPTDLKAPMRLESLTWSNEYGDRVLRSISAEFAPGSFIGIAGTNTIALRRLAERWWCRQV